MIRRTYTDGTAPVRRRELFAWAMYDFANSGYTTVVITAIFNAYFVGVVARGEPSATLWWTLALSVSYLAVIVTAPAIGAYADLRARKKRLLAIATVACAAATAMLAWCGEGDVALAVVLLVVSNIAFSTGENLVAAFLPELANDDAMGKLSGWGWALGYLGGLLVLALSLAVINRATAAGLSSSQAVPGTMLLTAGMFLLAALPSLVLLRERAAPQRVEGSRIYAIARERLVGAFSRSRELVDLRRFLACIVAYQAGVGTIITLAAVYTQEALGFTTEDSIKLILVVNLTAAIGAFVFGWVQDRVGHRATLAITLVGWLVAIGLLGLSSSLTVVWTAANVAGFCLGASQSAGRALVGYLCPPDREAEIFGLWGLATKLAMIVGSLSYGVVTWSTGGNHRVAIFANAIFFVIGLVLLARVDVKRGAAAARGAAVPA